MKNFPIIDKETGREYWISRSVCVLGLIILQGKYVLAVQRGKGTPDPEYVGSWCLPCGYVDFDETCKQAIRREVLEETSLDIPESEFEIFYIQDDPSKDKRQNITFRFECYLNDCNEIKVNKELSEPDEVENVKWINITEISNYKWAFNHDEILKEKIKESGIIRPQKKIIG